MPDILMPALSPTMEEGTLAKWLVKEGDKVGPGAPQLFGEGKTENPEGCELFPDLGAEFAPEVGVLAQGRYLLFAVAEDRFPEHLLFRCKRKIHGTLLEKEPGPLLVRFSRMHKIFPIEKTSTSPVSK